MTRGGELKDMRVARKGCQEDTALTRRRTCMRAKETATPYCGPPTGGGGAGAEAKGGV